MTMTTTTTDYRHHHHHHQHWQWLVCMLLCSIFLNKNLKVFWKDFSKGYMLGHTIMSAATCPVAYLIIWWWFSLNLVICIWHGVAHASELLVFYSMLTLQKHVVLAMVTVVGGCIQNVGRCWRVLLKSQHFQYTRYGLLVCKRCFFLY